MSVRRVPMPNSASSPAPRSPMTVIVRVAIIAVTAALFLQSTLHAMLGHRDIAVLSALAAPLGISAWGFARAGHHESAVMLLSIVLLTVVTLVLMLNPMGVHDVAITAYGGIVLVAALLLSRRNFLVIAGLTLLASGSAFMLEITGHIAGQVAGRSDWPQFAIFLLMTVVFGTIGRVASETLFGSLGAARLAAVGDPVTGLANRPGFLAKGAALLASAREASANAALVLVDLDGFRRIKVVIGYEAADLVLAEVARRLCGIAAEHLVARVGEDEFAVLCTALADEAASEALARKVHEALNFEFSGVAVRCAVGYARFPRDGDGVEGLLLAADSSLLAAKGGADGDRVAGPADRI